MNKEALLGLGLTEEQVNKVIDGFGVMIPKSRLDDKIAEVNDLTARITDYDSQLEELKKVDAAALQDKINELQTANTEAQTKFAEQLQDTQLRSELAIALHGKVHDTDVAIGLIDRNTLTMQDGKITGGLDTQLTALKESKSYLFVPDSAPPAGKTKIAGAIPHKTDSSLVPEPLSVGAQYAQNANSALKPAGNSPWNQ